MWMWISIGLLLSALPQKDVPPDAVVESEQQQMFRAKHDLDAFAPLYDRYFPRIYAFCARRARSPQEAEDLCSQVFLNALRGLQGYQGGLVSAWLFRIAHNIIANHYRGQKPIITLDGLDFPAEDRTHERLDHEEDQRILSGLIASLPDSKQTLLSLSFDGGLTSAEIGEMIGKSAEAVRVELHRVIKYLRERYFRLMEGQG